MKDIQDYWTRKSQRIERAVRDIPPDQRTLWMEIEPEPGGFHARVVLRLPTGTLVAFGCGRAERAAIDQAAGRLIETVADHLTRFGPGAPRSRSEMRREAPALAGFRRTLDRKAFFDLLRPALDGIARHAQRELSVAQMEGHLQPGEFTVADLTDEILVRAWDRFDARPPGRDLEHWVLDLLHEFLDERFTAQPPSNASLSEVIPEPEPIFAAEEGWIEEIDSLRPSIEPVTLDEEIRDFQAAEPWQEIAAQDEKDWILRQLQPLPRNHRRAFTLHAFEGWEIEEISQLQRRPEIEVARDVVTVRRFLKRRMETAGLTGE